ncbi:hypothetical protein [Methanocella sp. MCL-LM]|uniref:hypothetical protein n=1 Tax=Methanocella sp. MCL-LM TaxID=3412035 RepID=UPI003C78DA07
MFGFEEIDNVERFRQVSLKLAAVILIIVPYALAEREKEQANLIAGKHRYAQ